MFTPRQKRFIKEYPIDLNGHKAAIRAGFSEKTARQQASRLLSNANIQAAIQAAQEKIAGNLDITAEKVAAEFAKLAYSNMSEFVEWDKDGKVTIKPSSDLSTKQTAAIQEIIPTKTGIKIKLHDKKGSLDSLARHLGMFTDKTELSGEIVVYHTEMPNKPADAGMG